MKKRENRKRSFPIWRGLSLVITAIVGLVVWLARGPDFEVDFSRNIPWNSKNSPQKQLKEALRWVEDPMRWPNWFHSGMKITWEPQAAEKKLIPGAKATLTVDPKKSEWKRYSISMLLKRVVEVPASPSAEREVLVELELLGDSNGKIQKVFREVYFTLRFSEAGILGEARATTTSARSRLTARLSPRSVMNQLFYPHLLKLARLADGSQASHDESLIEGKISLY